MIKPKPALNNDFYFQKVFGDGEYIAAGQLMIPPGGHKPSKTTKDNTYVRQSSLPTHPLLFPFSFLLFVCLVCLLMVSHLTFHRFSTSSKAP